MGELGHGLCDPSRVNATELYMEKQISSFTSPILVLNGVTHSSIFGQSEPAPHRDSSESEPSRAPSAGSSAGIALHEDAAHESILSHT
jgi:hypothetical protein